MRSESSEGMSSFERELESELHRLLDPMQAGQAVPARRVVARPGRDLRKLLESINVPLVMVGRDLHIRWFTPAIEPLLNLLPTEMPTALT